MSRLVIFIFLLFFSVSYANNSSNTIHNSIDEGKKLLLIDEKFVDAILLFTKNLEVATKDKNTNAVAENIYWIAECLFQVRQLKELEEILQIGEEYMKRNKLDFVYQNLMLTKAKYLIDIGNTNDAIKLLIKAETGKHDNQFECKAKLILADAYYKIGELEKSKKLHEFVINNTKDSLQIAQAYNGIGSYYFMISDFDNASLFYNKSINICRNTVGLYHTRIAMAFYNLGLIANKNGDYEKSEKFIVYVLSIYIKKYGDFHPKTAEAYGTLGNVYTVGENIGKSIYYYNKELYALRNIYGETNPKLINNYMSFGEIYILTKDYSKAESEIRKALSLVEKFHGKKHNLYTQCIVKLCILLTQKKNYKYAEKLLKEVIIINIQEPDDYIPDIYFQLGSNYLAQKKYNDAIDYFQQANKLYVHFFGEKNVYSIDPLIEISNTYLQQNKLLDALKYANFALDKTLKKNKIIYPYDHWSCVLQILKCKKEMYYYNLLDLKNSKKDIELIKQTIKEANIIKQSYYSSGSQMYYTEKIAELNELGIYYLTHFYKKPDNYFLDNLLAFAENNKANLLRYKITTNASNEILPNTEKAKLLAITDKLNHFISLNEDQVYTPFNINDSILYYQNLHESFTKNIEKNYPKVYAIKYGQKSFSIKQIQDKLKENYSFLMYTNDAENYYCLSISKKNINYKICGNKQKIDSIILLYQSKIINKKFDKKLNQQLSQIILPKNLKENLIISSDALLQNISFDALYQSQTSDYMIYNHTIQYAFSSATYFNHPLASSNKNIISFFPNFLNTKYATLDNKKEQESLSSFSNYKQFQDSTATKRTFLKTFKNSSIVHIASHLIIDTISPLESSLIFQPNNDYLLTINDIWKLNTDAQLITLAACQSNYGKSQNGEGMQNFAWAFQYAGAHNILSTQWNASDKSTANIISDFYKNLIDGNSKQEALRLAKINYLKNTDAIGAQPFFWANYSIFTDDTEIKIAPSFFKKYGYLSIMILLLTFLSFKIIKQKKYV